MGTVKRNLVSAIILVVFLLLGLGSGQTSPEVTCADTTSAFVMSQQFVEGRLKAPTTAKFPMINAKGVEVAYAGECVHIISSYVDSQNGFGAMIRTKYVAKIRYNKADETYSLLELGIE
ncbi:hypothetical protein [Bdellovibrio bacteriovorus]|uniref:hypothetical protein n=1 Tax=Bdellovibrio bacteriovorus TaxID=959 RepID=UPI0035A961C6